MTTSQTDHERSNRRRRHPPRRGRSLRREPDRGTGSIVRHEDRPEQRGMGNRIERRLNALRVCGGAARSRVPWLKTSQAEILARKRNPERLGKIDIPGRTIEIGYDPAPPGRGCALTNCLPIRRRKHHRSEQLPDRRLPAVARQSRRVVRGVRPSRGTPSNALLRVPLPGA